MESSKSTNSCQIACITFRICSHRLISSILETHAGLNNVAKLRSQKLFWYLNVLMATNSHSEQKLTRILCKKKDITQCRSHQSTVLGGSKLETNLTFDNYAQSSCSQVSNLRYHAWHPRLIPLHQRNDPSNKNSLCIQKYRIEEIMDWKGIIPTW